MERTNNALRTPFFFNEKNIDAFNGAQGRILYVLWQEDGISIRSPSCFILVTRNPPFISIQKLLYSNLLKNILYRSFIVKSLYVLIGKFRFFQFSKLEFTIPYTYRFYKTLLHLCIFLHEL